MPDGATVIDLLAAITDGDESALAILKQTRAFIDGKQADRNAPLADGAEVTSCARSPGGADAGRPPPPERRHSPYFDAVEPAGRLRPPVCGSGCAPGA